MSARLPAAAIIIQEGWVERAVCAQIDPEMWFPEKGCSSRDAKAICFDCPVRAECLAYALNNSERHGIWGGLSERERRRLERSRRDRRVA